MKKPLSSLGVLLFGVCAFRHAGHGAASSNDFSAAEVAALPMVSCFAVFLCVFALRERTVVLKSNLTQRRKGAKRRKAKPGDYAMPLRP
jgi:hypothetical protein